MASKYFWKDPDSVEDFTIDWSDHLGTDTITGTPTWTVPSGITVDSSSNTTTAATVTLSGGTVDAFYTAVNRIVTTGGRTLEQSLHIRVRSK